MTDGILSWLGDILVVTGLVALVAGGVLLAFGLVLYYLERRTFTVLSWAFGGKATAIATGWIGTTVHELSHVLMCLVFRHKVTEVSFFRPDTQSGVMGYVGHSWNRKSLYQNLGLLFIGVAPLLGGCAALIGLGYLLVPGFSSVVDQAALLPHLEGNERMGAYLSWLLVVIRETLGALFASEQLGRWELWVYLYVSASVSSHLAPSPADMRGGLPGVGLVLGLLLAVNGGLLALGRDPLDYLARGDRYLGIALGLMTLAVLLSAVNFLVSYIVAALWYGVHGRGLLRPV